jgi:hypothetical protein
MGKAKDFSLGVALTDDPIELHILNQLGKLRQQNTRLKAHIEKTAAWTHLKEIDSWKPYDFYNYFCAKYQEKYKREFRLSGSIVRAYDRIEAFVKKNKLSNDTYKTFIDLAFSRYFNVVIKPVLGNLCSPSLFERLMGIASTPSTTEDLFALDQVISNESAVFEKEIRDEDVYGLS